MPAVPSRFLSIATPFVAPFSAPARPCHPAYIARRDTQAHMRANNAELIQKVANSIHEGYGDWKNNLSTYQKPVANHFVSGLVRNTLDTVLCKAIVAHTNQPKVQQVLTQISKTLGLAAQISVLAPGAFSPKMAAIIGVGGSLSHTVRSLARLLGHVYLAKSLLAISRGDQLALASLIASIAGAYAGTALANTVYQPTARPLQFKSTEAQPNSQTGQQLIKSLNTIDQAVGETIDKYFHFNFLIKHLFPAVNLATAQPALTARVINKN